MEHEPCYSAAYRKSVLLGDKGVTNWIQTDKEKYLRWFKQQAELGPADWDAVMRYLAKEAPALVLQSLRNSSKSPLLHLAALVFASHTVEFVFATAAADANHEISEALVAGQLWRAQQLRLRWHGAYIRLFAIQSLVCLGRWLARLAGFSRSHPEA